MHQVGYCGGALLPGPISGFVAFESVARESEDRGQSLQPRTENTSRGKQKTKTE